MCQQPVHAKAKQALLSLQTVKRPACRLIYTVNDTALQTKKIKHYDGRRGKEHIENKVLESKINCSGAYFIIISTAFRKSNAKLDIIITSPKYSCMSRPDNPKAFTKNIKILTVPSSKELFSYSSPLGCIWSTESLFCIYQFLYIHIGSKHFAEQRFTLSERHKLPTQPF